MKQFLNGPDVDVEQTSFSRSCEDRPYLYPSILYTSPPQACRLAPQSVCLVTVTTQESVDGVCGEGRTAGVCRYFPAEGVPVIQPDHPACRNTNPSVTNPPCPPWSPCSSSCRPNSCSCIPTSSSCSSPSRAKLLYQKLTALFWALLKVLTGS